MTAAGGAVAILAGGRARRLGGVVKPLLLVEGQRIIDRQLAVLRHLFDRIVIVANEPAPFADLGVAVIPDRRGPGLGPLAGIDAALAFFSSAPAVVCVAGDMPFLEPALLRALRDAPPALAVVPRVRGRAEPLCARYDRAFSPLVAAALAANALTVHTLLRDAGAVFLEEPALRALDPALRSFTNLNTPHDLLPAAGGDG